MAARWKWWQGIAAFATGHVGGIALAIGIGIVLHAIGAGRVIGMGELTVVVVLAGAALFWGRQKEGVAGLRDFGFQPTPSRAAVGWVALAYVSYLILAGIYTAAVHHAANNVIPRREIHGALAAAATLLTLVVVAPVGEEFFFRGFLYASLRNRLSIFWATAVTGSLFGLVHFLFGGVSLIAVPVMAIAGYALCLLYERTRSLYTTIAMHMTLNSIPTSLVLTGSAVPALAGIAFAALVFLMAPWRWRRTRGPVAA